MDIKADASGVATAPGTVRIERILPGPAERLWAFLTESEKRRQWLASGHMEPRIGGRVEHLFRHAEFAGEPNPERYAKMADSPVMTGTITQWDPPRVLAYTWPGDGGSSEVTFELFPEGGNVRLVLTHQRLADRAGMISVASGWGAHLNVLAARLAGSPVRGFWKDIERLEAVYRDRFKEQA